MTHEHDHQSIWSKWHEVIGKVVQNNIDNSFHKKMAADSNIKDRAKHLFRNLYNFIVACFFQILSVGPLPNHIAFIMDGNRTYAKKNNLEPKDSYRPGLLSVMSTIKQCFDLGIRYITIYTFSIDNFKRQPEEVKYLMDILLERIETFLEDDSFMKNYGVRLYFVGDLALLSKEVQAAVKKAMEVTSKNKNTYLIVCLAYTSADEITHATEESFPGKSKSGIIRLPDIEKRMYMSVAPEPDILIRTAGVTRLSNFLLWQTESCLLYSPSALWPEIGLWHLVWAVIIFQRHYFYLQKIRNSS